MTLLTQEEVKQAELASLKSLIGFHMEEVLQRAAEQARADSRLEEAIERYDERETRP